MAVLRRRSDVPLLGRDAELHSLTESFGRAQRGQGTVTLVEGEAGIGKSRLVEEALRTAAAAAPLAVRVGRADSEWSGPYTPLVSALRLDTASVLGDPALLATPSLFSGVPEGHLVAVERLVGLVESMAAQPVALVLEDLHWADPATLQALRAVARRTPPLPLALVLTFRPFPRRPELDRVVETLLAEGATHLTLDPLDDAAVGALTGALTGHAPDTALLAQAGRAGGNPLFLIELVTGLLAADGERRGSRPLPRTLRHLVLRRLDQLDDAALELLRMASVLGPAFSLEQLGAFAGRDATDLAPLLGAATRAGVLSDEDAGLAFRHDLVHAVVYDDMPVAVRRSLHAAAGRALAEAGAPAMDVARHLAEGATPGDDVAVDWLHAAALEVGARSPVTAVALLDRAIALARPDHPDLTTIRVLRCEHLLWAGRVADGEAAARDVLAGDVEAEVASRLHRLLSSALVVQGRPADAVAELATAADHLPRGPQRARLLGERAMGLLAAGDQAAARTAAEETLAAAEALDDGPATSVACAVLGRLESYEYRFDGAFALLDRATEAARRDRTREAIRYQSDFVLGLVLHDADRLDDVLATVARATAANEVAGIVWPQALFHGLSAFTHLRAGRLDDAATEAEAGVFSCEETGAYLAMVWCLSVFALVAVHRGQWQAAAAAAARAEEWFATGRSPLGADLMVLAQAHLADHDGEEGRAYDLLGGTWDLLGALGLRTGRHPLGVALVRSALGAGDAERAQAVTAAMEDAATDAPLASYVGAARQCRALVTGDTDDFLAAVDAFRASPRVLERARACEDAAVSVGGAEAGPLLDEALAIYDRAGAAADAARAARRGQRRRARPARPTTGWESLTPTELEIVRLVGEGLTNVQLARRRFTSRRTVEAHLRHVYEKLDVSTRAQLAAAAVRRFG